MFLALRSGAGKARDHLSSADYDTAGRLVYFGLMLLLLAQGAAACSQLFHLQELVPSRGDKRNCLIAIAATVGATVVASLGTGAHCYYERSLNAGGDAACSAAVTRWSVAMALVIIVQLIQSLLPVYLFRRLQTPMHRKISIYAAFAFPLLNIPIAAVAASTYSTFIRSGEDGIGIVNFLVVMEILLCWSLICPTIPCVRPMALRFTTHGLIVLGDGYGSQSGVAGRYGSKSKPSVSHNRSIGGADPEEIELRTDTFLNSNTCTTSCQTGETIDEDTSVRSYGVPSDQYGIVKTTEVRVSQDAIQPVPEQQPHDM